MFIYIFWEILFQHFFEISAYKFIETYKLQN
jgi:hypothetical protein